MTLSIEWFLLDNGMMNYLILRIACVMCGGRARHGRMLLFAAFGAGYALLSMTRAPVLKLFLPKLLLGGVMAVALIERPRAFLKALVCLYLAACMMGGVMLGLLMLFGGSFRGGAYVGTVPVRLALLCACVALVLPRCIVSVLHAIRLRSLHVRVMLRFDDRTLTLTALCDTGNLLIEPMSGLPVMIVRPGLLPHDRKGRPVAFRSVGGSGLLTAIRPDEAVAYLETPRYLTLLAAESAHGISAADAILPACILTEERRCCDANREERAEDNVETILEESAMAPLQRTAAQACEVDPVHPLGGDAAGAAPADGGAYVD